MLNKRQYTLLIRVHNNKTSVKSKLYLQPEFSHTFDEMLGGGFLAYEEKEVFIASKGYSALKDYRNEQKRIWFDRIFKFFSGLVSGIVIGFSLALLTFRFIP